MRKFTCCDVNLFRGCGDPPQHGISVGMPPKLRDDVASKPVLILHHAVGYPQMLGGLVDKCLGQGKGALQPRQVIWALAVAYRDKAEGLFPYVRQGVVVPVLEPFKDKPRCPDVLRKSRGCTAPDRTWKLVQRDDKSELPPWCFGPLVQQSLRGRFRQVCEALANRIVGPAAHPPRPEYAMRVKVGFVIVVREPEIEHLVRCNGRPIARFHETPPPASEL